MRGMYQEKSSSTETLVETELQKTRRRSRAKTARSRGSSRHYRGHWAWLSTAAAWSHSRSVQEYINNNHINISNIKLNKYITNIFNII